jgi:hypothetical protein
MSRSLGIISGAFALRNHLFALENDGFSGKTGVLPISDLMVALHAILREQCLREEGNLRAVRH